MILHAFVCRLLAEKQRRKPIKWRRKDPNPQPLDASAHEREPPSDQTRRISDETPVTQTRRISEETPAAQTTKGTSEEKNTRSVLAAKSSCHLGFARSRDEFKVQLFVHFNIYVFLLLEKGTFFLFFPQN